jgi:exopolyphosphatase/guanosine-5'-triphosphate,3'-diphosphate pyrophosphatase
LQLLANVARYHRGNPPKQKHDNYRELPAEDQYRVAALAAILRLALALDRTHRQHVAEVRARVGDDSVKITVQAHGDADVDLWAAERKVELFEKVFHRKVCFSARSAAAAPRRKRSSHPSKPRRRRTIRGSTNGAAPRSKSTRTRPP